MSMDHKLNALVTWGEEGSPAAEQLSCARYSQFRHSPLALFLLPHNNFYHNIYHFILGTFNVASYTAEEER